MKKLLLLVILFTSLRATAQDTLWVKQKDGLSYLLHKVQSGETLFQLSRKYAVPPAVLADINQVSYQEGLAGGSKFRIPVAEYNYIKTAGVPKSRPLFYKAGDEDDLRSISRMVNVSQSTIQRWNNMDSPEIEAGSVVQVGWISYDKSQVPFAAADTKPASNVAVKEVKPGSTGPIKNTTVPKKANSSALPAKPATTAKVKDTVVPVIVADTAAAEEETAFEQLYDQQVMGTTITEESGAAVFYALRTPASPGVYYAFHNTAIRGTILEIRNPANGKIIYAKVIGTIPNLKEYHNAIVGLSNNAAALLGATDRRMFCKLKYR